LNGSVVSSRLSGESFYSYPPTEDNSGSIRPVVTFDSVVELHLRSAVYQLQNRLVKLEPLAVITHLLPLLTRHVAEYKRAAQVLNQSGKRHLTWTDELDLTLAGLFGSPRSLHPALTNTSSSRRRLRVDEVHTLFICTNTSLHTHTHTHIYIYIYIAYLFV
jgi:hypothetical protein